MNKEKLTIDQNRLLINDHLIGHLGDRAILSTWLSKGTMDEIRNKLNCAIDVQTKQKKTQPSTTAIPGVKHTIAIASGKGGVGKSTLTIQLARQLSQSGARVGILDADIYGPSLNIFFPCTDVKLNGDKWQPYECDNLQLMSLAYVVAQPDAMAWRGPMAGKALLQLALQTNWKQLDYLLIDLPPGTGDVTLTMAQKLAIHAVLLVTHEHSLSQADLIRAASMFKKLNIPMLGYITNMSYIHCPHCKKSIKPFKQGNMNITTNHLGQYPWSEKAQMGQIDHNFYNLADHIMIAYDKIDDAKSQRINIPIQTGGKNGN